MPESKEARRQKIGLLIRRARETAGRTRKDCAAVLGISQALLVSYEEGRREPSLPQVEALAYYLRVPVRVLLDENSAAALAALRMNIDMGRIVEVRTHIIGARLRQARLDKGLALKEVAVPAGITSGKLAAYEVGARPVPITELEALASVLGLGTDGLLDVGVGALGEAQLAQEQHSQFEALPSDVRAFVADPRSLPYLRVAIRLSRLPAEDVRAAGQALVELSHIP